MKFYQVLLAFGVLTMAAAVEVDLPAEQDATVDQSIPDWKGGNGSWIDVYFTPAANPYYQDGLIRFDLSAYRGSTLNKAMLKLYAGDYLYPGPMELYRIAGDWEETTISWNTKPPVNKDIVAGYPLPVLTNAWHAIDVKNIVESWLTGAFPNQGFYLHMDAQPSLQTGGSFASREGGGSDKGPILHLDLQPASLGEEGKRPRPGPGIVFCNSLTSPVVIELSLDRAAWLKLKVHDVSGRAVETLIDNPVRPGSNRIALDTRRYRAGVYFLRLELGHYAWTGKITVVR